MNKMTIGISCVTAIGLIAIMAGIYRLGMLFG